MGDIAKGRMLGCSIEETPVLTTVFVLFFVKSIYG
jgi:hypothetical protein